MTIYIWFDYQPVLDKLLPSEASSQLLEVGENKTVDVLETAQGIQYQKFGIRDLLHAHVPSGILHQLRQQNPAHYLDSGKHHI